MLVVLGVGHEAHDWWDVLCWARSSRENQYLNVCVEREALEHMSVYVVLAKISGEHECVFGIGRGALEHMSYENLCVE